MCSFSFGKYDLLTKKKNQKLQQNLNLILNTFLAIVEMQSLHDAVALISKAKTIKSIKTFDVLVYICLDPHLWSQVLVYGQTSAFANASVSNKI